MSGDHEPTLNPPGLAQAAADSAGNHRAAASKSRERINPFYVLLVIVGIAFVITACAYFVMALKDLHGDSLTATPQAIAANTKFIQLVDQYGAKLLVGELVALGLGTFAAIATDRIWSRES